PLSVGGKVILVGPQPGLPEIGCAVEAVDPKHSQLRLELGSVDPHEMQPWAGAAVAIDRGGDLLYDRQHLRIASGHEASEGKLLVAHLQVIAKLTAVVLRLQSLNDADRREVGAAI